jgi:hypothetical protein
MTTFRARLAGLGLALLIAGPVHAQAPEHFDPKGNPPSRHTIAFVEQMRESLPFEDTRGFCQKDSV